MNYRKACVVCNEMFSSLRTDARYCSAACRQRATRQRRANAIEGEFERVRDINHAAAPELYYILANGGEKAARAAVRLFWLASGAAPVTIASVTDVIEAVTPASVTDTTRSISVTPASVADTARSKPTDSITPDDCRLLLRRMAPAKQELLWRGRSGELMTQPMGGWHIDDLAKQGYLLKADNGWYLSPLGLVLAQHIDQGGDGVSDWTRFMIRAAQTK